jgi:hypothetical protein
MTDEHAEDVPRSDKQLFSEQPSGTTEQKPTLRAVIHAHTSVSRSLWKYREVSGWCMKRRPPSDVNQFKKALGGRSLEQKSAAYHRAAAARARRLLAQATTPRVKNRLEVEMVQHQQIAAEIESACEPDTEGASSEDEVTAHSSETPRR